MKPAAGETCAYCASRVDANESAKACPQCARTHHAECWEEYGGCAVVSCAAGPSEGAVGSAQVSPPDAAQPTSTAAVSLGSYPPPPVAPVILPAVGGVAAQEWAPGTTTGPVSLPDAVRDGFKKYARFSGRSSRSAYWWWQFFCVGLVVIWWALAALSGSSEAVFTALGLGLVLGWLALILPSLALTVRRLHDMNASGWWILLFIVFGFLGPLVLVQYIWFCFPGTNGPNRFGPGYNDAAPQPIIIKTSS